ncbi:hypothetical protein TPHA_0P01420 [Tetrapisispora phaffii CBS 4417]|uniref:F-box domain-containing protein n=1 Tax=Tetrapisispora phaffii (strain ATCC 24235 / CBS 4417 / NBRC 1672 / NRRL Y-8282 / UCD 70-5) TaxID=1071381 RepID=G8C2C2_TETPH|nr:hypothetical protein TPHA_0P01420 [Tetrapisispora phaffii CBS 4417]CCE66300.1 hypothetical protein TPHA_0P01420 [Tetrapisispora phaffii CBS 4417]
MRELKLFGKTKYKVLTSLESYRSGNFSGIENHNDDQEVEYPLLHLLSLPKDILITILENVDRAELLTLCLVNSKFYDLISTRFIYTNVILNDKISLLKFNTLIHSEYHIKVANTIENSKSVSQNVRFLVRSIEFVSPQCQDSLYKYSKYYKKENSSLIGGSYFYFNQDQQPRAYKRSSSARRNTKKTSNAELDEYIDNLERKYVHYTYIELMLDIIDFLPNLSHLILSDIEQNFKIPLWYSVFNDGSRDFFKKIINGIQSMNANDLRTYEFSEKFISDYDSKFYSFKRIKKLELRGALDKREKPIVCLRPNLLCCFGIFNELTLENIIIDKESLDMPFEFVPFHLTTHMDGIYDLHSTIHFLTIKNCNIIPGNGILKLFRDYFKCVNSLELLSITSKYDLILGSCFSALKNLTIDCNSSVFTNEIIVDDDYFYKKDKNEITQQNDMLNNNSVDNNDIETLLEVQVDSSLQTPPPTSGVVISLDLGYIPRNLSTLDTPPLHNLKPAMITKEQNEFFKRSGIPEFHFFYHYFKDLWERLPYKNININVINIPFTNVYPLNPSIFWEQILFNSNKDQETLIATRAQEQDQFGEPTYSNRSNYFWMPMVRNCVKESLNSSKVSRELTAEEIEEVIDTVDPDIINNFNNYRYCKDIPNLNLWYFLKSLSKFRSVRIKMLRKWLFCTPRTRYDWEMLLKPVLKVNVPIEVRDKDGFVLYTYGEDLSNIGRS